MLAGKTTEEYTDDPWPIVLPGEAKPVSSRDVSKFVNSEFLHYYNFYTDIKCMGPPYVSSWLDWPYWIIQLVKTFDWVIEQAKRYNERRAYEQARKH